MHHCGEPTRGGGGRICNGEGAKGREAQQGGMTARERRLFPRHSCHGIPPDAILAEANRIQRKCSHVYTRMHVYTWCMYTRVCCTPGARECCRGTVWILLPHSPHPSRHPAWSRDGNPWQSECAKLRLLRIVVPTMSLRPTWFHPRVRAGAYRVRTWVLRVMALETNSWDRLVFRMPGRNSGTTSRNSSFSFRWYNITKFLNISLRVYV